MEKIHFEPKTLDSELVKEGLCAVSSLSENSFSKDQYFVVGGTATQSYLPSEYRRATSDIDLAILKPLGYADFKIFSKTAVDYLQSKGYEVTLEKGQNTYHLIYHNKEDNSNFPDACVIEFARRGTNYIKRNETRLEREFENSRNKPILGRGLIYRVSSPEDIIIPKIVREVGSLQRNPSFKGNLIKISNSSLENFEKYLKIIKALREEVTVHPGDPIASEKLRFFSDSLDVRMLYQVTGVNESYFNQVSEDWQKINEKSQERDTIFSYLLPQINLIN
jgi:hypothetical protein